VKLISWRIGILGYYSKNIQDPTEKHLLPRFLTRTLSNAVKCMDNIRLKSNFCFVLKNRQDKKLGS
jgi:hypothetical protein